MHCLVTVFVATDFKQSVTKEMLHIHHQKQTSKLSNQQVYCVKILSISKQDIQLNWTLLIQ